MGALRQRIGKYGLLGSLFVGLGGAGAFGVCHTICQIAIVALAAVGITVIGMPLAFLQEPWFVGLSFGIGGIFLALAYFAYKNHRKMVVVEHQCCKNSNT